MTRHWRDRAACAGYPPEWWEADGTDPGTVELALSICGWCPVREECLEDQLAWERGRGRWLIFGGMTPAERERYARSLRRRSA